jgi:penicillin-binding protein 1C
VEIRRLRPTGLAAAAAVTTLLLLMAGGVGLLLRQSDADRFPLPESLHPLTLEKQRLRYLDRLGGPLSATFDNPLNLHDQLPLHQIPPLLLRAMVISEDRRFYHHSGADWLARGHAALQNLLALRRVRGASTISEQVVRILHPRPRTLWSRWLEGLEAAELERRFTKNDILEFYLNQVPFDRRRRGIVQAAHLYFGRAPSTLSPSEILMVTVLVRAPARLSKPERRDELQRAVRHLAIRLNLCQAESDPPCRDLIAALPLPGDLRLPVAADHFLRYLEKNPASCTLRAKDAALIRTTIDPSLQHATQRQLEQHLKNLRGSDVRNGAALVVDHHSDEILAWVSVAADTSNPSGAWLDGVTSPRQPGSTLKPFLYALALDQGWTAATLLDDSPLSGQVGDGLHPFRNFSRRHYGPLRLRQALGNSLNIPAIRTIRFTGVDSFLGQLQKAGMDSLNRAADYYGEGLALGNGEVTLLELVRGYTVLARGGLFRPLRPTLDEEPPGRARRQVFSPESASIIADILADPQARRLEFGDGSILRFPVETAVKTGTSTDHRDTWALGFSSRHTIGIWMGNLDGRSTLGLTGANGPALVLRAIFAELHRRGAQRPLWRSPRLQRHAVCADTGTMAAHDCATINELFSPGTAPLTQGSFPLHQSNQVMAPSQATHLHQLRLIQPTPNLQLAMDPHIPDELEAYALRLAKHDLQGKGEVEWLINGAVVGNSPADQNSFLWPLRRGTHLAQARLHHREEMVESPVVSFTVK